MRYVASRWLRRTASSCMEAFSMHPRDTRDRPVTKLRLLYEGKSHRFSSPQAAAGRASTGYELVLQVHPQGIHQRNWFHFGGSCNEVELIDRYHNEKRTTRRCSSRRLPNAVCSWQ